MARSSGVRFGCWACSPHAAMQDGQNNLFHAAKCNSNIKHKSGVLVPTECPFWPTSPSMVCFFRGTCACLLLAACDVGNAATLLGCTDARCRGEHHPDVH